MASTSETGNAKNVSNFFTLIEFAKGFGVKYNPSKTRIKIPQLILKHISAELNLKNVIIDNTAYNDRVNERIAEFSDVNPLSTRLINALESSSNATNEKINNAKTFNRKIQGKRATTIENTVDPNTPAPITISSSQQSFHQKIQHFAGILSVLQSETTYSPNETELKIVTIQVKEANLIARNKAVATAHTTISNTRLARDKNLYLDDTGMVDIALEVKKYIKSVFTTSSPEYALISGIEFKKPKKKK